MHIAEQWDELRPSTPDSNAEIRGDSALCERSRSSIGVLRKLRADALMLLRA
jgi:hypothetical protein